MKNSELENAMYHNASMCCSAIKQVLPKVQDGNLKKELSRQLGDYRNEINTVVSNMHRENSRPTQPALMKQVMSKAGIALSLIRDNSPEHISQMMIQGTNMGIIDINRALNSAKDLSPQTAKQVKSLLAKEQEHIDSLKRYL